MRVSSRGDTLDRRRRRYFEGAHRNQFLSFIRRMLFDREH